MKRSDSKRQEQLRELLAEKKRKLWTLVRTDLFDALGEELHAQYDIPQDIGEQGILDLLTDTGLAVADIRRRELTQMEEALHKLEEGHYGFCEDCGEAIDEARLRVAPYASCCLACQQRREAPTAGGGLTL